MSALPIASLPKIWDGDNRKKEEFFEMCVNGLHVCLTTLLLLTMLIFACHVSRHVWIAPPLEFLWTVDQLWFTEVNSIKWTELFTFIKLNVCVVCSLLYDCLLAYSFFDVVNFNSLLTVYLLQNFTQVKLLWLLIMVTYIFSVRTWRHLVVQRCKAKTKGGKIFPQNHIHSILFIK